MRKIFLSALPSGEGRGSGPLRSSGRVRCEGVSGSASRRPFAPLPDIEEHERERDDEREEYHDHGRSVADVVEGEGLQIEEDVERLRRGAWAALADHVNNVEGLDGVDGA